MRTFWRGFAIGLPGLVLVAMGGAYYWYAQVSAPCVSPITYRVGQFDGQFGISKTDFLSAAKEAAAVWNTAAGKTLLVYSAQGTLPINLIYDSRQASTQKTQGLQTTIDAGKQTADSVKQEFSNLKAQYDSDNAGYDASVAVYNQKLNAYNQEVAYWNQKGGAPRSEYEKISAEKTQLDSERSGLETTRLAVNAEAARVNAMIDQYNLLVDHVNATVQTINQTAGREFEEGEYVRDSSGTRINIYEFSDHAKLVRVLAHEMGHALGLDHNADPLSIMYYLNQSTNISPTKDDVASLQALCKQAIPIR